MRLIVLNLNSQNGIAQKKWNRIQHLFKDDLIYRIKKNETEALPLETWLLKNVKNKNDSVIAAGGDGTVSSLIQWVQRLKLEVTLGMIGLGSSNDYHKPHDRPEMQWCEKIPIRIDFENAKAMDLLEISLNFQGKTSVYWSGLNASIGMTANGNAIFNDPKSFASRIKKYSVDLSMGSAALQAFMENKPLPLEVTVDGQSLEAEEWVTLSVFKRAYFAGALHFDEAPGVDDGRLGLALTRKCSQFQQLKILLGLASGNFSKQKNCELSFHQQVEFESERPFVFEIDGETQLAEKVKVRVLARALRMCP